MRYQNPLFGQKLAQWEQEPVLAKRPLAAIKMLGAFFGHRQDTGEIGPRLITVYPLEVEHDSGT